MDECLEMHRAVRTKLDQKGLSIVHLENQIRRSNYNSRKSLNEDNDLLDKLKLEKDELAS